MQQIFDESELEFEIPLHVRHATELLLISEFVEMFSDPIITDIFRPIADTKNDLFQSPRKNNLSGILQL